MSTTLIFIHGRRQEDHTPEELEREWRAGLAAGLVRADMSSADSIPVVFPYYAKLLARITDELTQSNADIDLEALPADPAEPGPLHPYLGADIGLAERELIRSMVAAKQGDLEGVGLAGILSWGVARQWLLWLAQHTPADQAYIRAFLRDVAVYLRRARVQVLELVREEIQTVTDGEVILVTHSLGTVVARDLLDDESLRERTRLWVTAGSPLGLEAVRSNLLPGGGTANPGVPWLSTYDVNDIVALGHPLVHTWGPPLNDVEVDNGSAPHSIARYLAHPEVAEPIGQELGLAQP
ncbi:hypothetical protein [Streptomyces sp. YIM B13508]|uniref:hypothetical protein n=1 Tax=Streptomyces sp. YIM B13508 TaxID=3366315 RepID=UPI003677B2BC